MNNELEKTLKQIGLTPGEIDVYLALFKLGTSTTGGITKKANISSSKVYEVLQRLINKGLANYVIQKGIKNYSATPAENLISFLEEKRESLKEAQATIKKCIPQLEKNRKNKETPEAIIYRGRKGALIVLKEIIESGKSGKEVVGFGADDYPTYFPAQIKEYSSISKKYKFKERLIFRKGYISPNKNAKIKYLPEEYINPTRTIIYGDKVAIVDFTEPMTSVVIEKEEIAKAYLNHFNLLWKIAT